MRLVDLIEFIHISATNQATAKSGRGYSSYSSDGDVPFSLYHFHLSIQEQVSKEGKFSGASCQKISKGKIFKIKLLFSQNFVFWKPNLVFRSLRTFFFMPQGRHNILLLKTSYSEIHRVFFEYCSRYRA